MKTVRIEEEDHQKLVKIAAKQTLQTGRQCDLKGAVRFLLDFYEKHKGKVGE